MKIYKTLIKLRFAKINPCKYIYIYSEDSIPAILHSIKSSNNDDNNNDTFVSCFF